MTVELEIGNHILTFDPIRGISNYPDGLETGTELTSPSKDHSTFARSTSWCASHLYSSQFASIKRSSVC